MGFFGPQLIFGPRIFLGFVGIPRDFFRFWFLPSVDYPCHLKSRTPPWVYHKVVAEK